MNKYLSYENRIINSISHLCQKWECQLQFVPNLPANACIVRYDNRYIIFISDKLDKRLLPLSLFHEFGHIKYNTIKKNPKKNNYFIELISNLYAINRLLFIFPFHSKIMLIFLSFISEKKMYRYFVNKTKVGGKILYEKIFKN